MARKEQNGNLDPGFGVTPCLEFIPFIVSGSLMSVTTAEMQEWVGKRMFKVA